MPDPIDLLRRRRSVKPNELRPPGPTPAELEMAPDHRLAGARPRQADALAVRRVRGLMFSSETRKDSLAFIEGTGEFVCNFTTYDLREQVNQTSAPLARGVNEMARAGLEAAPSRLVRPPRVAASPCALECLWLKTVSLDDCDGRPVDRHVVFGQVVGVHIDDRFINDGLLDTGAMRPIQRAGYNDYYTVMSETRFSMRRPPGGSGS
jgi:flavin reductase (DIM6/NTAB) family NADH-FMN oxidoreductase RutF